MSIISKSLFPLIFLAGCQIVPLSFDSVRFEKIVDLSYKVNDAKSKCSETSIGGLLYFLDEQSKRTNYFVQYSKENNETKQSMQIIADQISKITNEYAKSTKSETYCKEKLGIIDTELQKVIEGQQRETEGKQ